MPCFKFKIVDFFSNFSNNLFQWGAFYLFIADFFATQIIGGVNELVVLL